MREKINKARKNKKGFSLVELIVVIAIMAVLVAILAPQFVKYVEKSRAAKDEKMVSEVQTSIEAALANESVYDTLPSTGASVSFSGTALTTGSIGWTALSTEVEKTITIANTKLVSKTYTSDGASVSINIDAKGAVTATLTKGTAYR